MADSGPHEIEPADSLSTAAPLDEGAPSTAVADVLLLRGERGWLSPPLAHLGGSTTPTVSPAFTVEVEASAGGGGLAELFELCDSGALAGHTLVLAGAADIPGAVWGEILTAAALRASVTAIAVDGLARDLADLPTGAPALWARSVCTVGPGRAIRVASMGEPVQIGGVRVACRDLVVSDAGGLVALSADHAASVLAEARRYAAGEAAVVDALERGEPAADAYDHKRRVVDSLLRGSS